MHVNTQIAYAIDSAQDKASYDEHAKRILSNKYILAYIMQGTVKECYGMSIEEIVLCIEGTPEINKTSLYPGQTSDSITGAQTESKVPNEGNIYYDIRFYAILPGEEKITKLLLNVEAQRDYHVGYDLVPRGIFYSARMLSSQLDTEFTTDNYNNIKKVYSIWICINAPAYAQNTITEYSMNQEKIIGDFRGKARYDILTTTFICLGHPDDSTSDLITMLSTLFSEHISETRKKDILEQEYHIPMTIELGKEINSMCNLGEGIEIQSCKNNARKLFENGASYELVRASIDILSDEELQEIYDEVMAGVPS